MSPGHAGAACQFQQWWQDSAALHRFISDLIVGELSRLRPGAPKLSTRDLVAGTRIDQDLGADSLELLSLGTALAEAIHLHESGIEDYLLARRSMSEWVDIAAQGLDFYSDKLTFRTSGSTGVPKPCTHTLTVLWEEVEQLAILFRGRRRILTAVPAHHIYGFLFTIMLPQALGLSSNSASDAARAAVIDIRDSLPSSIASRAQPGDLIVGHPDFWRAFTASGPVSAQDVVGVTSSGPCPDSTSDAVIDIGLAALHQIYGASETAGIGWRRSRSEPYALFPYWSRDHENPDCLIRTVDGEQSINVMAPDRLEWLAPSLFQVGTRHDAAVQVGGINVFPAQVREILLRHPDVQDVAVRLMRPDEGNRLKAFIVPKPGVDDENALRTNLYRWVETHLPPVARPRAFTIGRRIPHSPSGKLADWPLNASLDTV